MTSIHELKKEMDDEVREEQNDTLLGYEDRKTGVFKTVDLTKVSNKQLNMMATIRALEEQVDHLTEDRAHFEEQWKYWQAKALGFLIRLQKHEPDACLDRR